jgi:regulatory subunit for Cdc7p protein kinase
MDRKPLVNRNPTVRYEKRPRSSDPPAFRPSSKRVKPSAPSPATRKDKDRKHAERAEREQQKAEFKDKFTRAFPTFTFCFDIDNVGPVDGLVSMIRQLGGVWPLFQCLSTFLSHLISLESR